MITRTPLVRSSTVYDFGPAQRSGTTGRDVGSNQLHNQDSRHVQPPPLLPPGIIIEAASSVSGDLFSCEIPKAHDGFVARVDKTSSAMISQESRSTSMSQDSQPTSTSQDSQSQPIARARRTRAPSTDPDQPTPATLAELGIKVRDFAYEPRLPRPPLPPPSPKAIKRPGDWAADEMPDAKRSRPLDRTVTEPYIDVPSIRRRLGDSPGPSRQNPLATNPRSLSFRPQPAWPNAHAVQYPDLPVDANTHGYTQYNRNFPSYYQRPLPPTSGAKTRTPEPTPPATPIGSPRWRSQGDCSPSQMEGLELPSLPPPLLTQLTRGSEKLQEHASNIERSVSQFSSMSLSSPPDSPGHTELDSFAAVTTMGLPSLSHFQPEPDLPAVTTQRYSLRKRPDHRPRSSVSTTRNTKTSTKRAAAAPMTTRQRAKRTPLQLD